MATSARTAANLRVADRTPARGEGRRLALVLWHGAVGGAESFTVALAQRMRSLGTGAEVIFIANPDRLAERLRAAGVPYRTLGFSRGRDAACHPRRFANDVALVGADGALLVACGFLGAALRCGGYRPPIVAIEHGALLAMPSIGWPRRYLLRIGGVGGAWANDAEVGVSDFMLEQMLRHPHARRTQRIHNGIDPLRYFSATASARDAADAAPVVGFAGRLIAGKGVDHLIDAVAQVHPTQPIKLLIAGDGAERPRLERLARARGLAKAVHFVGHREDIPAFWRGVDVAVVPSGIAESFSMTTLEAMACAKPVVATDRGAIPELIADGVTGTLVPPESAKALARALITYARRPDLRLAHGAAARVRAVERFNIDNCAQAYLALFADLARDSCTSR